MHIIQGPRDTDQSKLPSGTHSETQLPHEKSDESDELDLIDESSSVSPMQFYGSTSGKQKMTLKARPFPMSTVHAVNEGDIALEEDVTSVSDEIITQNPLQV